MKKSILIYLILLVFSIFCLSACSDGADTTLFSVNMSGAEVTADGQILSDINIFITCRESTSSSDRETERYDGNVSFSNARQALITDSLLHCIRHPDADTDYYEFYGIGYSTTLDCYTSVQLVVNSDLSSCIIIFDDSIYIGSTDPDFDPQAILEQFEYIEN